MKYAQEKSVALVSGACRGIGQATAIILRQRGYAVVGLYKTSDDRAKRLSKEHQIDMKKVDVTDAAAVKELFRYIAANYGRLDALVNNAGDDVPGRIEEYSIKNWRDMIDLNLNSVFLMSKYAIPYLKKSPHAVIINMSSRLGINELAAPEYLPYGTAKAGVNFLTMGLAKELEGEGIRVNAVVPTPTKTDLFDRIFTAEEERDLQAKGKVGMPEEAAELVIQLIEDSSASGKILFDKRVAH